MPKSKSKKKKNNNKNEDLSEWNGPLPDNLLDIGHVTDSKVVQILKARYGNDQIYTLMGDVQVAINPFKRIKFTIADYTQCKMVLSQLKKLSPHPYQMGAIAFFQLTQIGNNQSCIISGESGAGKTETTKLILEFLTGQSAEQSKGKDIAQRMMQSNPILEGFGNAKTLRNNNSSRFGKWMTIFFDAKRFDLTGANVINYLLEKSRLCHQAKSERSYHVLYSMCKSAKNGKYGWLHRFKLKAGCAHFHYLNGGECVDVDTIDDEKEFDNMVCAFQAFKFSQPAIEQIFECLSGILHLGNITLDNIASTKSLALGAKFLGFKEKDLRKHIVNKTLLVRNKETSIPLNASGCANARDAISKDIYDRLFNHLVRQINAKLNTSKGTESKQPMIGVLDIFGFEIFEKNQFEQFCINFCNERLQNHFQRYCWDREKEIYDEQGIDIDHLNFTNNDKTCDALEGIIQIIQDEITMPKGNDRNILSKMDAKYTAHKHYKRGKHVQLSLDGPHSVLMLLS